MWLDNLVAIKKASGKTLNQISSDSGVPIGTLNKLFAGQTKDPKLDTVRAVVHALGYTLDDLDDSPKSAKKAPLYSSEAMKLARDYDELDNYGKNVVRLVADAEKTRCQEQVKATTTKLYIAARDGSRIETEVEGDLTLPEEDTPFPR